MVTERWPSWQTHVLISLSSLVHWRSPTSGRCGVACRLSSCIWRCWWACRPHRPFCSTSSDHSPSWNCHRSCIPRRHDHVSTRFGVEEHLSQQQKQEEGLCGSRKSCESNELRIRLFLSAPFLYRQGVRSPESTQWENQFPQLVLWPSRVCLCVAALPPSLSPSFPLSLFPSIAVYPCPLRICQQRTTGSQRVLANRKFSFSCNEAVGYMLSVKWLCIQVFIQPMYCLREIQVQCLLNQLWNRFKPGSIGGLGPIACPSISFLSDRIQLQITAPCPKPFSCEIEVSSRLGVREDQGIPTKGCKSLWPEFPAVHKLRLQQKNMILFAVSQNYMNYKHLLSS